MPWGHISLAPEVGFHRITVNRFAVDPVVSEVARTQGHANGARVIRYGKGQAEAAIRQGVLMDIPAQQFNIERIGLDGDGPVHLPLRQHADGDDSYIGADIQEYAFAFAGNEVLVAQIAQHVPAKVIFIVSPEVQALSDGFILEADGQASLLGMQSGGIAETAVHFPYPFTNKTA